MKSSNSESETIVSYDQTAAEFAVRWSELRLERALNAFTSRVGGQRRVLDLGCGPGRDDEFLKELGCQVIGLDLSAGMLHQARRRLPAAPLLRADLRYPPLQSASLDGVWACASLLHLPRADLPAALDQIARLLRRPSGALCLSLKGGEGERWVTGRGEQRYFFAYYQPTEVETMLQRAGFRVLESWTNADQAGRQELWLNFVAGVDLN